MRKIVFILLAFLVLGCSTPTVPKRNVSTMSNGELLRAYYEVNEAVAARDRAAQGAATRGSMFETGMIEAGAARVKQEKTDLRMELQRRGITP